VMTGIESVVGRFMSGRIRLTAHPTRNFGMQLQLW